MYLTGHWGKESIPYIDAGVMGVMNTPAHGRPVRPGWTFAADSGCFNRATYVGDEAYVAWLDRQPREKCLFATAPDVVGDATATLALADSWLARIRQLGFPAALVTQDGLTPAMVPWGELDWLFIGGTNEHKLGPEAAALIAAARDRGIPVHVGRVNSQARFLAFAALGVETCDGTFLAYGPATLLPELLGWIRHHKTQPGLFEVAP